MKKIRLLTKLTMISLLLIGNISLRADQVKGDQKSPTCEVTLEKCVKAVEKLKEANDSNKEVIKKQDELIEAQDDKIENLEENNGLHVVGHVLSVILLIAFGIPTF